MDQPHEPRASDPSTHAPIGESGGATPHAGEREPSGGGKPAGARRPLRPGDDAPSGAPGTGESICRACGGRGTLAGGSPCPDCGGTGTVTAAIGGA